jgi:glycine/D-amino acid oxidase-like deaminating enzyme
VTGLAPAAGPVFWLEQALADDESDGCTPLAGKLRADVCIVGGGYTGLWTALELRALAPDVSVVVLESDACGFGASGRNGGWMTSWVNEIDALVTRFGSEAGVWLARESSATIARIHEFTREHGIECHFRQEGTLWAAGTPGQLSVIRAVASTAEENGLGHLFDELSGEELRCRTGASLPLGGVLVRDSASVQPALLARGLRRIALEQGVRIFEGSQMMRLERGRVAHVVTPAGRVEADQVVLATNAWAASVRELRRTLVIVGSQIVLTEPIPDRLGSLAWARGGLLGDARLFVHYAQVTTEGRIAFGRGGGAIGPLGRVIPKHFYDPASAAEVAEDFYSWFPQLRDVRLTHAWGGAVDRAPGHLPFVGALGDHENVHYGVGFSGKGVGPSALVGRILARRVLRIDDQLTSCALVSGPPGYLPPEPLRFAGSVLVRRAVRSAEEREQAGRPVGPIARLAKRLVSFSLPPRRRRC